MSTNERPPGDEPERDAWLTQALRHAPDADAAPPSALSDAILRQARAAAKTSTNLSAARPVRPRASVDGWKAAWSWLARPSVATGFASVMVATLVGVMWWDRPLDETLQRPPPDSTSSRVASSAPVVAAPAAPVPAPTASQVPAPRAAVRGPSAHTEPAKSAVPRDKLEASPKADAELASREPADDSRNANAAARAQPAPPRETAAMSKSVARNEPSRFADAAPSSPATEAVTAASSRAPSLAAAPPTSQAAPAAFAAAPTQDAAGAQPSRRGREAALAPAMTLQALTASIAREPQRWTWQRSAGALPATDSLVEWLRQLGAATSRAQARPTVEAPPAEKPLRLFQDGSLVATVIVDAEAAWFIPATSPPARTPLSPELAATLQRSLDLAAP